MGRKTEVFISKSVIKGGLMKKYCLGLLSILAMMLLLSGCSTTNDKTSSVSILYGSCAFLSLVVLVIYCYAIKQKEIWFILLFGAIFVANIGYLSLSISKNLEEALLANRIVYLGSVLLPMSIMMIILTITKIKYKRWIPGLLTVIITIVFLITASPGYLDIYYKEVSFEMINGVPALHKVYGFCHNLYILYILAFYMIMIGIVVYAIAKKKTASKTHAVILSIAVGINIAVWMLERAIYIEFELLAVTYLLTGIFLLSLHIMILENERLRALADATASVPMVTEDFSEEVPLTNSVINDTKTSTNDNSAQYESFLNGLKELTPTERTIYNYYIEGKNTSQIMIALNIKENTLKFHNKNIYGKLSVSSRKQLLEIYKYLKQTGNYPMN